MFMKNEGIKNYVWLYLLLEILGGKIRVARMFVANI